MSIHHTRKGFSYQDYVAVKIFLEQYLGGELREFYVDYLYDDVKELSHDVMYVSEQDGLRNPSCIEVKTGEMFITERDLIGKALLEIYNYLHNDAAAKYQIFVSRDFKSNLGECWVALQSLRSGLPLARISPEQRIRMNLIKGLPHMHEIAISNNDFKSFISRLDIEHVLPGLEYSASHNTGLELEIQGLIARLGEEFLTVNMEVPRNRLVQIYQLTHELIYVTTIYAGTNTDVFPYYLLAIAKFFSVMNQEVKQHDVTQLDADRANFLKILELHGGKVEQPTEDTLTGIIEIGVVS